MHLPAVQIVFLTFSTSLNLALLRTLLFPTVKKEDIQFKDQALIWKTSLDLAVNFQNLKVGTKCWKQIQPEALHILDNRVSLLPNQEAHQAGAYPSFCSMKRLGVYLPPPPPGWDARKKIRGRQTNSPVIVSGVPSPREKKKKKTAKKKGTPDRRLG